MSAVAAFRASYRRCFAKRKPPPQLVAQGVNKFNEPDSPWYPTRFVVSSANIYATKAFTLKQASAPPPVSASLHPSILVNVKTGFEKGLMHYRKEDSHCADSTAVEQHLDLIPSWSSEWARLRQLRGKGVKIDKEEDGKYYFRDIALYYVHPLVAKLARIDPLRLTITSEIPPSFAGQRGDLNFALALDGHKLLTVCVEAKTGDNLKRFYENPRKTKGFVWPALSSPFIDIRPFARPSMPPHVEGATAMSTKLGLQMYEAKARFGFFYAPPYFVLTELVILHNDEAHLLLGPLCADDPSLPNPSSLVKCLAAVFLSAIKEYAVEDTSEDIKVALRAITKAIQQHDVGGPGRVTRSKKKYIASRVCACALVRITSSGTVVV